MLFSFGKRTLGLLEEGQSYQLINFSITKYENVKYTTMCWEGSEVNHIEELEGVVTSVDPLVMEAECTILNEPNIAVVFKIDTFSSVSDVGLAQSQLMETKPGAATRNVESSRLHIL